MSRRFALLVNPVAAGGRSIRALPAVTAELHRLGAPHRVVKTESLAHARDEAAAAAAAGETVVGIGGDGLIGRLAGELRRSPAALAVVRGGRGNDFARVLGVPSDPAAAARVAVEGRERLVDVAQVNGEPFLGIASLGFDSDVQKIANETKVVRGQLVYVYATLKALAAWRHARFQVTVDGERHEITGYSAAVANTGVFGGGMRLVPHAELDDGRLDVLMSEEGSKLRFLRNLPRVFKGTHVNEPTTHFLRGATVEVRADRPFKVYADGDPIADLPIHAGVEPKCLRVIVPDP